MLKEKDRLWLEYRVNVGNIAEEDILQYMDKVMVAAKSRDGTVETIIIPVRNEESSVRLIYDPKGKHNRHQLKLAKRYMELAIKDFEENYKKRAE